MRNASDMLANVDNSFAIVSHRWRNGALAQLGERLLCKHQVIGSIPIGSTTTRTNIQFDEDTSSGVAIRR